MRDFDKMADEVVSAAQAFVTRSLAGMTERIVELEQRLAAIPAGPPGKDGSPGSDGEKGADGSIGPPGERGPAGESGPRGEAGDPGVSGSDGAPGRDGKDADAALILPLIADEVAKAIALIPKVLDGRDGLPGLAGRDGTKGSDGKDGADGFSLEDFEATLDGRTLTLRFVRGEVVKERQLVLPIPLDCGVYKPDQQYARGDGVTYGGSFWIAQMETEEKPGVGGGWRLAIKRGQDGKDGKPGERGIEGKEGRAGRDLTQMAFDGSKY